MVGMLCLLILARFDDPHQGEVESLSSDVFIEWSLMNNAGWRAVSRGELRLAEDRFAEAIKVIKPYYKHDPRLLARSYTDLAWVLHREGRNEEALPLADWGLKARESWLAPDSDAVAQSLSILGMIETELGKLDQAETHLAKSLAIVDTRHGRNSIQASNALMDLAKVQFARRKYPQAAASYRRILAMPVQVIDENSGDRMVAYLGLADIEEARGNLKEAIEQLRHVEKFVGERYPVDQDNLSKVRSRIAELQKKINQK
jgi:tetratricopeptide (TPR) repeat protein